eukprot:43800-Pyramimonas_sp.AAC.1
MPTCRAVKVWRYFDDTIAPRDLAGEVKGRERLEDFSNKTHFPASLTLGTCAHKKTKVLKVPKPPPPKRCPWAPRRRPRTGFSFRA